MQKLTTLLQYPLLHHSCKTYATLLQHPCNSSATLLQNSCNIPAKLKLTCNTCNFPATHAKLMQNSCNTSATLLQHLQISCITHTKLLQHFCNTPATLLHHLQNSCKTRVTLLQYPPATLLQLASTPRLGHDPATLQPVIKGHQTRHLLVSSDHTSLRSSLSLSPVSLSPGLVLSHGHLSSLSVPVSSSL